MSGADLNYALTYSVATASAVEDESRLEAEAKGWLDALGTTHDWTTVREYRRMVRLWARRWTRLHVVTDAEVATYFRDRLRLVRKKTAAKEQSAMRSLFDWACEQGLLEHIPTVARFPRRAVGTPTTRPHKLATVPLSEPEILAIIERAATRTPGSRNGHGGFMLRWLLALAYWTALRPETLFSLQTPLDYRRGQARLTIRDEIDKARFGRELPLCDEARAALDAACTETSAGLIFGRHNYRLWLRRSACGIIDAERMRHLSLYDFRHARLTRLCEQSANLTGIAFMSGHLRVDTLASRYVHPHRRAAEEVVRSTARQLSFADLMRSDAGARR